VRPRVLGSAREEMSGVTATEQRRGRAQERAGGGGWRARSLGIDGKPDREDAEPESERTKMASPLGSDFSAIFFTDSFSFGDCVGVGLMSCGWSGNMVKKKEVQEAITSMSGDTQIRMKIFNLIIKKIKA
jgi:hypothetical protein